VGKAKNLRRRLSKYRNATREKAHRKMRILVREAHALAYEICESEQAALLRESELLRSLRPPFNVDGAYAFLYPSVGVGTWDKHTRQVEANLKSLMHFYEADAVRLRAALRTLGKTVTYVSQDERDALFIRSTALGAAALQGRDVVVAAPAAT